MVFTRRLLLALVLLSGLVGASATYRPAHAQQSATIAVTAGISSAMSIRACDTTANFGSGLTALGATPSGATDQIIMSQRGDSALGEGTVYIWTPTCPAGESFLRVESTLPWTAATCAIENGGTSSLTVGGSDLGWNRTSVLQGPPTYSWADFSSKFGTSCASPASSLASSFGVFDFDFSYTLTVDVADQEGSFLTVTTWMFTP